MSTNTTNLTRRQALRRGAAAGAVIWTVPMVLSSSARATNGGSTGATGGGPCESVELAWELQYAVGSQTDVDLSRARFCEINVGEGWTILEWMGTFTLPFGQVCQFRRFEAHTVGNSAEPLDDSTAAPTTTESTAAPTTTESTVAPTTTTPAPTTTAAEDEPSATVAPETTLAPAPVAPETPVAPAPVAADPLTPNPVDTIAIDMSGRTDITIGDVYGYFRIVDVVPA